MEGFDFGHAMSVRTYVSWRRVKYSEGPCAGCRRSRHLINGRCMPCRCPLMYRGLVERGVPWSSASILGNMLVKGRREGRSMAAIHGLMSFVHPVLMENIRIRNGKLAVADPKLCWLRRSGWAAEPTYGRK